MPLYLHNACAKKSVPIYARLIQVRTLLDSCLKYFDYFCFLPGIARLPPPLAYRLARLRGSWVFWSREESRRHAIASVRRAFPDFTAEKARDVIRRHFQIKSCDEMETFWYDRPVDFLERLVRSEGFDGLRQAIERRDPVLIFSGHFNSVGLFIVFLGRSGIRHHFVGRPFGAFHPAHLKFSQRRIRWMEEGSGQPCIYTGGTARPAIVEALGRAEPVLMLVDVPPSALRRVESVKFFGAPAWFGSGVAALQQQSRARLFFLRNVRDPDWIHQTVSVEEIPTDPKASARETLQRVVDCIESHIRSHPDHWHAWDSFALFFQRPPEIAP